MEKLQIYENAQKEKIDLQTFDLVQQNYSQLLSKLEKLATDLDSNYENLTVGRKGLEISVSNVSPAAVQAESTLDRMSEGDYSRFVSDVWIGVVLTLLIVSIIFFICSCFLYHKFQQWKNSYRANNSSDVAPDILRRYDVDLESLPSYTIVSGLPTYDDALEEFRKAGIILTPQIPIIKIFESPDPNNKEQQDGDSVDGGNNGGGETNNCTCNSSNLNVPAATANNGNPVIELSPEQLKLLSQKRLSLQISFAMPPRRNSRINLYREANRNNLLRSLESRDLTIPPIHRSASVISLSNERAILEQRLKYLQHRGSLT